MKSLRSRLLLGLIGSMIVVQIVIYALLCAKIEDEIDDLFDDELERSALVFSHGAAPLPVAAPHRQVENPQEGMVITIWQGEQRQPQLQSSRLPGLPRATPAGFSKIVLDGHQWRLFAVQSGDLFVVAAQPADVRNVAARRITLRVLAPLILVLPLAALMIWLAVSYGLRPLVRITSDLLARSDRDLAPIDMTRLPSDVAPLVRALNELMLRLGSIIATQRNFIADAAHELLTPLTALRLQAQLLARAESGNRRRDLLVELQGGVSRTLQLARQLLVLARHGADTESREASAVNLSGVLANVLAIHKPLAEAKGIHLGLSGDTDCIVAGSEESLNTLMANLLENAIKYSNDDGTVELRTRRVADRVLVEIEDSGPGIPPEERERVFDRFYRRSGNTASGNGLGLAIAREIAARHGATIVLESSVDLGGVLARVDLPAVGRPREAGQALQQVA